MSTTEANRTSVDGVPDHLVPDPKHQIYQLEGRYIQLLEQRVRDLEKTVADRRTANPDIARDKHPGSSPEKPNHNKMHGRVYGGDLPEADGNRYEDLEHPEQYTVVFHEIRQTRGGSTAVYYEIEIRGRDVRDLLKETIKEYPGQNWEGTIVTISYPYMPLVHNWDALTQAAAPIADDCEEVRLAREDLSEVLKCIQTVPELTNYFKLRQSHLQARITTFETMWTLFVPGQLVFAKPFMDTAQIFTIQHAPFQWPKISAEERPAALGCWCYDWDGKEVRRTYYDILIEHFRGTKAITDMPCYPLEYCPNKEHLYNNLALRGAWYNAVIREPKGKRRMFDYTGEALAGKRTTLGKDAEDDRNSALTVRRITLDNMLGLDRRRSEHKNVAKTITMTGKVIIDARAFLDYGSPTIVLGNLTVRESDEKSSADDDLSQIQASIQLKGVNILPEDLTSLEKRYLALFPPRLLGYATQKKVWGQFHVDNMKTVGAPKEDGFKVTLQLNNEYKDMISALVKTHGGDRTVTDIVKGKGQGLVVLLHGPPGVGKTLTAETIAEATGKPLLIVSVAEIGLNTATAERNLESMFLLASSWEAILLIDEADVFLENRSSEYGTERNALVSVLLRALEYYHGIMILTTNRINTLDVAVQSRIHLAIRYEDLTKKQKQEVFKFYLDQLGSKVRERTAIDEWIDEAGAEAEVNGRQIRNIVSAASALAYNAREDLCKEHLKKVMKVSKEFTNDLQKTTKAVRDQNEAGRMR